MSAGVVDLPNTQTLNISGTGISSTGALESVGGNNIVEGSVILDNQPAFSPATTPASNVAIDVAATSPTDNLTITGVISQAPGTTLGLSVNLAPPANPGVLVLDPIHRQQHLWRHDHGIRRRPEHPAKRRAGKPVLQRRHGRRKRASLQLDGSVTPLVVTSETLTLNGPGFNGAGALDDVVDNDAMTPNVWKGAVILASNTAVGAEAGATVQITGQVKIPIRCR